NTLADYAIVGGCAALFGSVVTIGFMAVFYRRDKVEKKTRKGCMKRTADGGWTRMEEHETSYFAERTGV
ncbi:hypothetical protein AAVH_32240, partial [Aphelenchoides avenae]